MINDGLSFNQNGSNDTTLISEIFDIYAISYKTCLLNENTHRN